MKQGRLTSWIIIFSLIASVIAGAISVSVDMANADTGDVGYFDDLVAAARLDCNTNFLTKFDQYTDYMKQNFNDLLICVIHDDGTGNWYFGSFLPNQSNYTWGWLLNSNDTFYRFYSIKPDNNYNYGLYSQYCFKLNNGSYTDSGTFHSTLNYITNNNVNYSDTGRAYMVNPQITGTSGRKVYVNKDIPTYKDLNRADYWTANLYSGTYVPPIIEYNWFKFNLGDRWYITTYDQSLVNMMPTGDDTFWVWSFDVYRYDSDDPSVLTLFSSDMQYISYAENFISQNLTNVSSSGVYCYDVTDYINSAEYIFFAQATFYQVLDYPGGMVLGDVMAESDDVVYMSLTPEEQDPARNEAWTIINNYFENYPTVTIVPDQLASQLSGNKAVTGGSGRIQIPEQLYKWRYDGLTTIGIDSEFHYDLSATGLDPDDSTQMSMINYDILNVCIIPSRPDATIDYQFGHPIPLHTCIWDYRYENDVNDDYKVNITVGANMTYEDVFDFYDLILIVSPDVFWTLDPRRTYTWSDINSTFGLDGRMAYAGDDIVRGYFDEHFSADAQFPCYWVLTDNAVRKSQLYVFCDGFSKMYELASEYVQKKDLWDNSFFEWSMSIFYQLESLNGHLSAIKTAIQSIDAKIDTVIQNLQDLNTDPTEDSTDPWYLSLWNFVTQFRPSDSQIGTGINYINDNLDDVPALPYMTPVPALPTPGGG